MFKRLFNFRFHIIPFFNPFFRWQSSSLKDNCGVIQKKREVPVIVSLTSIEDRFDILPKALYSLIMQSRKPDKIILWLSDKTKSVSEIPYEITRFIKYGIEIRFVKDIGPYTKAIYAFKEFPNSIVITADDDIYYRKHWLDRLYMSYAAHPNDIHAHRVHFVKYSNGLIAPYESWDKHIKKEGASYNYFLTGAGGVLYPPKCFSNEVFREDVFLNCAPTADDIWFWIMALANNKKIRLVKDHYNNLINTNIWNTLLGKTLYSKNRKGRNDEQLNNVLKYYGRNILSKLDNLR